MRENKYQPIENTKNIEIVQNSKNLNIASNSDAKYRDPNGILNPSTMKVIKKEKFLHTLLLSFAFTILIIASILMILICLQIGVFSETNYVGYKILLGFIIFLSFTFGTKNLIQKIAWKKTQINLRENARGGNYIGNEVIFEKTYRSIVLKNVNLLWTNIFLITYVGIFALIIYGLYSSGTWILGKENSAFFLSINWVNILDNAFGNTILVCSLCGISLAGCVIFYTVIALYDKKRINDLDNILGERAIEISSKINTDKRNLNKMWMKIYFVCVLLTILLPIILLVIMFWKKIIKIKK
ncbi:MSC_0882 family membrane protein [Mycoplasmopsis meleagridis]|uniref:MSC_0882 family membrane protein n=1 Tax=Mycoplasmopsis meleagridis TaxID=29561 RepID=UPI00073D6CEF|nr:hypothetical protein [Mycoplasmopsis meleagridis]KUH47385.1 hypothetical protein ASB56_01605 [Mycoplasmopsis meleagridis]